MIIGCNSRTCISWMSGFIHPDFKIPDAFPSLQIDFSYFTFY